MFEIYLGHLQYISAICQKDITPLFIGCHKLVFTLFEHCQFLFVIALYPACFIKTGRFPFTQCIVFVFKSVLYYLKLQLSNSTYQFSL